jgi:hypothetical protein
VRPGRDPRKEAPRARREVLHEAQRVHEPPRVARGDAPPLARGLL